MRKKIMAVLLLVVTMTMLFGTVSVFAKDYTTYDKNDEVTGTIKGLPDTEDELKKQFPYSDGCYLIAGTWYTLDFPNLKFTAIGETDAKYKKLKEKEKDIALDKIDQITGALGMEADITSGEELISEELRGLIATIIGGITIVILTAVGLFTALDIFYLVIPTLHTYLDDNAGANGRTDKNGNVKPRFVSNDACQAYREGSENQKNVIMVYLKKRIIAYIAVAVVVFLLLTGQLTAIIKFVLKLISGLLTSATSI